MNYQSPGTNIEVSSQLPLGVQLLQVFIPQRDFLILERDADQVRSTFALVDKTPKVMFSCRENLTSAIFFGIIHLYVFNLSLDYQSRCQGIHPLFKVR